MTANSHDVLLVGLPASGKSTFLAALFHRLQVGGHGLRLGRMPDERDYLIELEKEWLSLRPLTRSQHHTPKRVSLSVIEEATGSDISFEIPDVVGEVYENAWEHGTWGEEIRGRVLTCTGLLLFVRADDIRRAELIDVAASPGSGQPQPETPWDPATAPTQSKLCDLLEQMVELRAGSLPPLAVVVSAWDTVAHHGLVPSAWLEWELPLLHQWVRSRLAPSHIGVFGVSAQGGDLLDHEVRRNLAQEPQDRPLPDAAVDIVVPLVWLASNG